MTNIVDRLFDEAPIADRAPDEPVLDFSIATADLRQLVERVSKVVSTRDVMPVLKHIQVEAIPGRGQVVRNRIRMTATDMELTLRVQTPEVAVHTPGTAVVPARKLLDILKTAIRATDARVTVIAGAMNVQIGATSWKVRVPTGADFPLFPRLDEGVGTVVDLDAFCDAIGDVRFAAGDGDRPALAAIHFADGLVTAGDGARFAQAPFPVSLPGPLVLPTAAADRIFALAVSRHDECTASISDMGRYIAVLIGTDLFLAAKHVHPYPDVSAALLRPVMANRHELTVDRDELRTALRRLAVTVDTDTRGIALHISRGRLLATSRDRDGNETTNTCAAGWTGTPRTLSVHHAHLTDAVVKHEGPLLIFKLGEDTKTRRSSILLRDDRGRTSVVPQLHLPWIDV